MGRWSIATVSTVLLIVSATAPWAAHAVDDEDPRLASGAFVGVHFVYVVSDFDFDSPSLSADDAPGVEIFAGYRFNRYVSLEGVLSYLGEFGITSRQPFTVDTDAWGLSFMPEVKVYPLADVLPAWVQPFGLFGVGVVFAHAEGFGSDSDATAGFRFGGGADFYLLPQLVLRAGGGYVLAASDLDLFGVDVRPNYAPISLGLEYRF